MSSPEDARKAFQEKYERRFWRFREIEAKYVGETPYRWSAEEFALLGDAEKCYAARAYYACLALSVSVIEIHLRRIYGLKGKGARTLFRRAGIANETKWLLDLRDSVMHGNPHHLVRYQPHGDVENELEEKCLHALHLLHGLPARFKNEWNSKSE